MKKLLKESEIRKMMKFANIGALTDGFVEKLNETSLYDEDDALMEDEELEEGMLEDEDEESEVREATHDDEAPAEDPDEAPDVDLDEPDLDEPDLDEPGLDEPVGDVGGGSVEAGLEGLNAFLTAAIEHPEEVREKVNVELSDEQALDEPALDMPPVGPEDPPAGEEGEAALSPSPEDELGPDDELEEAQIELEEDDAFVNEVVRRVAKRLLNK